MVGSLIERAIPKTDGVSKALTMVYSSYKMLNVCLINVHLSETSKILFILSHKLSLVKGFVLYIKSYHFESVYSVRNWDE